MFSWRLWGVTILSVKNKLIVLLFFTFSYSFESNFGFFGEKDKDTFDISLSSSFSSLDAYGSYDNWDDYSSSLYVYENRTFNQNALIHIYWQYIELIYGSNAQEYYDNDFTTTANQINLNINLSSNYSYSTEGQNIFVGIEIIDRSNSYYDDKYTERTIGYFYKEGFLAVYGVYNFGDHEMGSEAIDISGFDFGLIWQLTDNFAMDFGLGVKSFSNGISDVEQSSYKLKMIMDL